MSRDKALDELMEELIRSGADKELGSAVINILETRQNFEKMTAALKMVSKPTRTWILGTAVLISEPE